MRLLQMIDELREVGSTLSFRIGGSWTEPNTWVGFPSEGYIEGSGFGPERTSEVSGIKASLSKNEHLGRFVPPRRTSIRQQVIGVVGQHGFMFDEDDEDCIIILLEDRPR